MTSTRSNRSSRRSTSAGLSRRMRSSSGSRVRAGASGMIERNRSYLLVPAAGAGEGVGHLARCLRLARTLKGRVTFLTARLDPAARAYLASEILRFPKRGRPGTVARPGSGTRWDLVLIDARRTSRGELDALMEHGQAVCLDEGGQARQYASFLVDAFPCAPGSRPPNLSSPAFLRAPRAGTETGRPSGKKSAGELRRRRPRATEREAPQDPPP